MTHHSESVDVRRFWTVALLAVLDDPDRQSEHNHAAQLLELFATPSDGPTLERVLLDERRAPWVRTYLLRAFARRQIVISNVGLEALLAEFVEVLTPPQDRRLAPRWSERLASVDAVATLSSIARTSGADARFMEWLGSLDARVAHAVVVENRRMATRLSRDHRAVLVRACAAGGLLDEKVAWASFDVAASQAWVLDSGAPLDLAELESATRDISPDELDAVFRGRTTQLATAVGALALPPTFLIRHAPLEELRALAWVQLRRADTQLRQGERRVNYWRPFEVLAALPDAMAQLDAVLADATLSDVIRDACKERKLRAATSLTTLKGASCGDVLAELWLEEPSEALAPVLTWAAGSDDLALQHAGLRALGVESPEAFPSRPHHPLIELLRLGCEASEGDCAASDALIEAARNSPHVILRAQALRSLSLAKPRPPNYLRVCVAALKDNETYDMFYEPAASEAAICLGRHPDLPIEPAVRALVEAALARKTDDVWWAYESAIRSWIDHTPARIRPVWYWAYAAAEAARADGSLDG
ncbi:MAG: hypothetical protein R3B40_28780 [Polyangiales bacterium]